MIDYDIIGQSISYYEDIHGFVRIESPWTVTEQVSNITKPPNAKSFKLDHENKKVLVASGEQSFLYLYLKGFLPRGMFQTVTPCFRSETFDLFHTKYFIKNELIITDDVSDKQLEFIVKCAFDFFSQFFPEDGWLKVIDTGHKTFDINYKDIELGSYGIRQCDFLKWIYGTGAAEPRITQTMQKYGIPLKKN